MVIQNIQTCNYSHNKITFRAHCIKVKQCELNCRNSSDVKPSVQFKSIVCSHIKKTLPQSKFHYHKFNNRIVCWNCCLQHALGRYLFILYYLLADRRGSFEILFSSVLWLVYSQSERNKMEKAYALCFVWFELK